MKKIKVLIVDDEYLALQLLENFIEEVPELELVGKTKSPVAALDLLNQESIDLLFLDIQMPTFDLNVVDYLLKPFSFERFLQAVHKAKSQLHNVALRSASISINKEEDPYFLSVKANSKVVKVFYDEILFIEGLKEYVKMVCENERIVTFERLKNMEAILPADQFLRVHKSYIVNTEKVTSVKGNLLTIGTHLIPISRSKKKMVIQKIF